MNDFSARLNQYSRNLGQFVFIYNAVEFTPKLRRTQQ